MRGCCSGHNLYDMFFPSTAEHEWSLQLQSGPPPGTGPCLQQRIHNCWNYIWMFKTNNVESGTSKGEVVCVLSTMPWRCLLCLITRHTTKMNGTVEVQLHAFLSSGLDGCEQLDSHPAALPPGKQPLLPIWQEEGWASEPVWTQQQRQKTSCPCWESNPIHLVCNLVTILTQLL